jgi:hypothetical protein
MVTRSRQARRAGLTVVIGLALTAASCSGHKPVFPVHGQVLDAKQQPAVGALVFFYAAKADPKDPLKPLGKVDESGRFTLTTYKEGDGAPAGEYVITIAWPPPKKTPFEQVGGDQLQGRYSNPEKSTLRFTVENKPDNEVPTIKLK